MKVSETLDFIEQEIIDPETRASLPDRRILLKWYSRELSRLSSFEEWDFLAVRQAPLVVLTEGKSNYRLPDEFPTNFVQSYDEWSGEKRFLCKLSDDNGENFLEYASPGSFFARNLQSETNGCPREYTIMTTSGALKEIWVGSPPDSTARTINGVYIPTNWNVDDEDEVPALPGNNRYLENALLARIYRTSNPQLSLACAADAKQDLDALHMSVARNRAAVMRPVRDPNGRGRRGSYY